jgi:hypothetical protein
MELSHYTEYALEKSKTNYYFDKYKYKIYIRTENLFLLRRLKNIENLNEYLNEDCYVSYSSYTKKSVLEVMSNYSDINVEIKKFILDLVSAKIDIKVVFCGANSIVIYHHEETKNKIQELISKLVSLYDEIKTPKLGIKLLYSTKLDNFEKGVIYQVNPKYKYRMYFGSATRRIQNNDLTCVREYLIDKNNDIKLNLSAIRWMRHRNTYGIWYGMTIDMNNDYHATYLNMLYPGIVLKLCKIEKRINTTETDEVNCGENLRTIDSDHSEQVS